MSDEESDRQATLREHQEEQFQRLADAADAMAATAQTSARVHDQLADRMPHAAERAERERNLAAAERAAAEAFRAQKLPSQAVREVVRTRGSVPPPDREK